MNKKEFAEALTLSYKHDGLSAFSGSVSYPSMKEVCLLLDEIEMLLFPGFYNILQSQTTVTMQVDRCLDMLRNVLKKTVCYERSHTGDSDLLLDQVMSLFLESFINLRTYLIEDATAIYKGDPAAKSVEEVVLSYVTFRAIVAYRIANFFYVKGFTLFARMIAESSHQKTSIDIHPGATIGRSFCIDHGTGVVIGETSVIGDHVKLYQGVTLGAFSVSKSDSDVKRHPTIENNVTIYAMSTILGGDTIIREGSIIGANVWLTKSVPKFSKIKLSTIS